MSSVEHPDHYNQLSMETWDWMQLGMEKAEYVGFLKGCIYKYLHRYKHKGTPIEDIDKAIAYLHKLKSIEEENLR